MYDNYKYFEDIPTVEKPRSRFDRSAGHKTAYSTGELIPTYIDEVLPGDTITMDYSHVTRMTTPITPVMDNACKDVYAFFVPMRLIWKHAKEFFGENNTTHWEQPTPYEIPQITSPDTGWDIGSLADYMGIPTGVGHLSINHLPFRAYCKIWSDWFRDENLKDPIMFNDDETTLAGINYDSTTYDYVTDTQLGALPAKVAKYHDYFTSALPEPQKGPDVFVPLGESAPVNYAESKVTGTTTDTNVVGKQALIGVAPNQYVGTVPIFSTNEATTTLVDGSKYVSFVADLTNAQGATINQLRQAFAVQRYYEALARGGSRYVEMIRNIFGVVSPDARQQRSEFLGARRFQINMDQVLQTSSTDTVTPQGNTAAYSCTVNSDDLFTYSATEHGYIFVLECVRTSHSYQQGIEKLWNRKKMVDFYVPQFANLGEQQIKNKEIYAQGSNVLDSDGNVVDEQVFGYQEAWAEYRYKPNRISGKLRSTATGSLDIWHYGDKYTSLPMLSSEWIDETPVNLQRTLAVENEPQFVVDTYFKSVWTRIMPTYSVPGLLDHH